MAVVQQGNAVLRTMKISISFNCLYSKYDRFTVMLTGCGKQGVGSAMTNLRSGFQVGAVFKHPVVLLGVGSFLQDVTVHISFVFNRLRSNYDRFTVTLTGCEKPRFGSTMTNLRSGFQVGAVFKHPVVLLGVGSFLQDVTVHISFVFNRLRSNYDRFTVTLTGCEKPRFGSTMTNLRSGFQIWTVFKHPVVLLGVGYFLQDVTV